LRIPISPTERELAKCLGEEGIVSSVPEEFGADALVVSAQGILGIQRKELPHDFLISVQDGRLGKETTLLREKCDFAIVVGEGHFRYYPDGSVATKAPREVHNKVYRRFTRGSIQKIIMEICMVKGCMYLETDDILDTVRLIRTTFEFMNSTIHVGLSRMPKTKGAWGTPTIPELQMGILQAFPGIGPGLAQAIYNHFGRTPLMWTCTVDELNNVPKIGANRAWKLYQCLPPIGINL